MRTDSGRGLPQSKTLPRDPKPTSRKFDFSNTTIKPLIELANTELKKL